MAKRISLKQLSIDKDNTAIVTAVGLGAFIIVFSLMASYSLVQQMNYHSRVISKKKTALKQLKVNAAEVDKLKASYTAFADAQENVLGGNSKGAGEKDGENPRLILDALPSKYDFPALTTSLEKVFKDYRIESLTGTDDEVTQSTAPSTGTPQPVEIPFSITLDSAPQSTKRIFETFEKSIRPVQIQKIEIAGKEAELKVTVDGKTYFQPQKIFDVKKAIVR